MDYFNKLYNLYLQRQYNSILSQSGGLACSKLKKKECSSHKECDWVVKKGCKKKTAPKKKPVAPKKKPVAPKKKPVAPKKKPVAPKKKPVAPKKKPVAPKKKPVAPKKKSALRIAKFFDIAQELQSSSLDIIVRQKGINPGDIIFVGVDESTPERPEYGITFYYSGLAKSSGEMGQFLDGEIFYNAYSIENIKDYASELFPSVKYDKALKELVMWGQKFPKNPSNRLPGERLTAEWIPYEAPKKKASPAPKKKTAPLMKKDRISASEYYKKFGEEAIGDIVDVRNNGELKCLLKRSNGTVYWASKSKSGEGQEQCGHGLPGKWRPNTRIGQDEREQDMIAAGYVYNEDGELYDPTMGMDDDEREEYEARHPPLRRVPGYEQYGYW